MKLRRMGLPLHVARLAEGMYSRTILLRDVREEEIWKI
jgi:hypothetical protein